MNLCQSTQSRQRQAMISTQGHQLGLGADRRDRLSLSQLSQRLGHLLTSNVVVKGCDWNIATVNNLGPVAVWVNISTGVESPERNLSGRGVTNSTRAKSGA